MRVAGIVRTARGQLVRDRAPEPVDIGRSRIGPSTDGLRESRREQGPIGPAQLRPSSRGAGRGGFQELSPPAVRARWRRNRAAQLSRGAARLGRYGCRRSGNAVSAGVSRPPRRVELRGGPPDDAARVGRPSVRHPVRAADSAAAERRALVQPLAPDRQHGLPDDRGGGPPGSSAGGPVAPSRVGPGDDPEHHRAGQFLGRHGCGGQAAKPLRPVEPAMGDHGPHDRRRRGSDRLWARAHRLPGQLPARLHRFLAGGRRELPLLTPDSGGRPPAGPSRHGARGAASDHRPGAV